MKKLILIALAALFISPTLALAHEHDVYTIGGKTYNIVIGSLNEPLVVDDKSGLDFTVTEGLGTPAKPVTGLDQTLKVEMIAGDTKKEMNMTPSYGKLGSYQTLFYPTVPTTFTYHIFGTIDDVPVDLSFACNPAGHARTPDDTSKLEVSSNVTRTLKSGAFGCAEEKATLGFPEASKASVDLATSKKTTTATVLSTVALALSLLALSTAWRKR